MQRSKLFSLGGLRSAGPLCHDARLHEHPKMFGENHGAIGAAVGFLSDFEHDPEKWTPVFGKDPALAIQRGLPESGRRTPIGLAVLSTVSKDSGTAYPRS
jgi:hypothetical protein